MGMVGGSMILYPEQVILDHEICQNAYDLFQSFEFDQTDLALEVIADVGPKDHFLLQKHTRQHIRDFRLSRLLRQKDEQGNLRDPRQLALEEFIHIERSHHPEPLPDNVLDELDRILAAADIEAQRLED